jgi:photosystem II stability/assembly factor-like uncharacterized protein
MGSALVAERVCRYAATGRGWLLAAAIALGLLAPVAPAAAGIGMWTSAGPDGGPVFALAAHPTLRGVLIAGTKTNGILKSTDGGATWQPAQRGMGGAWVRSFAFDPAHATVIYAGLTEAGPSPVWKSADGGASWQPASRGLPSGADALALAVDPRHSRIVYAATGAGLYRSADNGASWQSRAIGLPTGGVRAIAADPEPPETLYAGAIGAGVFRSTDGGATWTAAGLASARVAALAVEPRTSRVYAATDSGVFVSTDRGRSWVLRLSMSSSCLALDNRSGTIAYAGGTEIWRSRNRGVTWERGQADLGGATVMALAPGTAAPGTVYAGTVDVTGFLGALLQSRDSGATWSVGGRGLVNRDVAGFAVYYPFDTYYLSDVNQGLFRSFDAGLHWSQVVLPFTTPFTVAGNIATDPTLDHLYVIDSVNGGLLRTTDGDTWERLALQPVPRLPPGSGLLDLALTSLGFDPRDPATLYGAGIESVFKSSDRGLTWRAIVPSRTDAIYYQIKLDPAAPDTLYAAGARFDAASTPIAALLLKSTDAGVTWTDVSSGLPAGIVRVAVDRTSKLYAGTGAGLFESDDGGGSWRLLTDLPSEPVVAISATYGDDVFVVQATAGVWRSADGGASWQSLNSGLVDFQANLLVEFEYPYRTLFLGHIEAGLQSYRLPE